MEVIAEAAGVTRPALYYHYAGRRELILAVMAEAGGQVVEQIRQETAFQAATLDLVVTSSTRMVELSLADPVCRQLATPAGEHLVAELLRGEEMLAIQHDFWIPLLTAAIAAGEIRDDLAVEDVINWLIFVQLSLANIGGDFGYLEDGRVRATLERFLGPALRPR